MVFLFDVFFDDYEKSVPMKLSGKEIYSVRDKRIVTDFAVSKILLPEESAENAEKQCEKWLKAELHPNILQLYDYVYQNGCFYAAHEWHHGMMHTLSETIADQSFYDFKNADSLVTKVLKIGEGILSALAYAQTLGLFHGALNSESVYLMPTGIKIGDFWSFSENTNAVSSCALIMLELLCGKKCFENCEDVIQRFDEIRHQFLCHVPDDVIQLIQDCLTDPEYSVLDAWEDLYSICNFEVPCSFPFLPPETVPESPYTHINRAVIGSRRFDSDKELERALELAPDNAFVVYHRALPDVLNGSCTPFDVMKKIERECNKGTCALIKNPDFIYGGMECLCDRPNLYDRPMLKEDLTECSFPCEDGTVFSAAFKCYKGVISCVWKTADGQEIDVLTQPNCENQFGRLVISDKYVEYVEKSTGRRLRVTTVTNLATMAVSFSPSGEYLGIAESEKKYIYHFKIFRVSEQLQEPERCFFSNPYLNIIEEYQNINYRSAMMKLKDGWKKSVGAYAEQLDEWEKDIRINALPDFALAKRKLLPYLTNVNKKISSMIWEKQFSENINQCRISPDSTYSLAIADDCRKLYIIWNRTGKILGEYTLKTGQQYALKYAQFETIDEFNQNIQEITVWYQSLEDKKPDYCETYSVTPESIGVIGYETDENPDELCMSGRETAAAELLKDVFPDYAGITDSQDSLLLAFKENKLRLYAADFHPEWNSIRNREKFVYFNHKMQMNYPEEMPVQPIRTVQPEQPKMDIPVPVQKPDILKGKEYLTYLGEIMRDLKNKLSQCVLGQENAVSAFCDAWFNAELFRNSTVQKPRAIFTFAGPPGVGKTLLAESAAKIIGRPIRKFNMSTYSVRDAVRALSGFEFTYVDSAPGALTRYVLQNPECVLIFDEIEKASEEVLRLFLQMLDRGELEDLYFSTASKAKPENPFVVSEKVGISEEDQELLEKYIEAGNKVSFKDAIIIFTTNTAKNLYETSEHQHSLSPQTIFNAIAEDINPSTGRPYFAPEFVSRLASGSILMFKHLKPHDLISIERSIFNKISATLMNDYQIKLILGRDTDNAQEVNRLLTALLLSVGGIPDARRIESYINGFVKSQFQRAVLESGLGAELQNIRFEMPSEFSQRQIRDLFIENEIPSVLVYARPDIYANLKKHCPDLDIYYADTAVKAAVIAAQKNIKLALIDIFYSSDPVQSVSGDKSVIAMGAKILRRGTEVIRSLQKEFPDLPIYLLQADEDHNYESNTVRSYLDAGVRGMIKAQPAEIIKITETLYMQSVAEELARTQKVLHYETRLKVDEANHTVRVILSDLVLDHAPKASDREDLVAPCERPEDKFDDIIGSESAKKELKHIVSYLNHPAAFAVKGYPVPTGVLLYGAPGTGKTMLARACASESSVSFIATQGSTLRAQGVNGVKKIFSTARRNAPCIIFIDEIDSVGKQRTGRDTYTEAILNTLLAEMDGFHKDAKKPIVVIAATNADLGDGSGIAQLDEALARRFSKTIKIDEPEEDDRKALLKLFTGNKLSEDELETYAGMTIGFSPAEIKKCVMSALQEAIDKGIELNGLCLENAIEYQISGSESQTLTEEELRIVAWHETGHAICHIYAGYIPLYVTVVSRGGYGGYMSSSMDARKKFPSRKDMLFSILTGLGGRAGESIYFDDPDNITISASEDLYRVTAIAYDMINKFGLADGLAVYENMMGEHPRSREFVNRILQKQYRLAKQIIQNNIELVRALVDALCKKRRLTGKEIKEIVDQIGFDRTVITDSEKDGESNEKSE